MASATIRHIIDCVRAVVISSIVCGIGVAGFPAFGAPEPSTVVEVAPPRNQTDAERLVERAEACLTADRHAEAEQILRAVLQVFPDDARAHAAIIKACASRDLAAVSGASRAAQQRLSDRFAIHQTNRFVLFSDVPADLTLQSAHWVERAHEEFMRFARECDLRPLPLQHKLVCVLFDRREDYLAFAQSHDGLSNVAFTGYYSPRWDRVVFSVDDNPAARRGVDSTVTAQARPAAAKSLLGFEDGAAAAASNPCSTDHHTHAPASFGNAPAKCIHETIHQLMFHTRLMRSDVQYPLWICEGLSTAFETDAPDEPFGPDRDYAPRLEAFEQLKQREDLVPLRDLVTVTHISSSKSRLLRVVYQQSYSLVTWMCRERKAELRQYLSLMRQQPSGRMSATRHLDIFEQAFGDIDRLESAWLEYEKTRQSR